MSDRLADERLEGRLVDFFSFVDVDRAAYVSVEARVEETGRTIAQTSGRLPARILHMGSFTGFHLISWNIWRSQPYSPMP